MDKYRRVKKPRSESPIQENEIRITTKGKMRSYITYATNLLEVCVAQQPEQQQQQQRLSLDTTIT
jgi:hypothetical protein